MIKIRGVNLKVILLSDKVEVVEVDDLFEYVNSKMDFANDTCLSKIDPNLYLIYDDGLTEGYDNKLANKLKNETAPFYYQGDCVIIRANEHWNSDWDSYLDITEKDYNKILKVINEQLYRRGF